MDGAQGVAYTNTGPVWVGGPSADKRPFGATVERNERLAEQLVDALKRIDRRVSGRSDPQMTQAPEIESNERDLERIAFSTNMFLEKAVELTQRLAGDVGANG